MKVVWQIANIRHILETNWKPWMRLKEGIVNDTVKIKFNPHLGSNSGRRGCEHHAFANWATGNKRLLPCKSISIFAITIMSELLHGLLLHFSYLKVGHSTEKCTSWNFERQVIKLSRLSSSIRNGSVSKGVVLTTPRSRVRSQAGISGWTIFEEVRQFNALWRHLVSKFSVYRHQK